MKLCPHCNLPVPDPRGNNIRWGIKFGPMQARLIDLLRRGGVTGLNRNDVIEVLYATADDYPAPNIVPVMTKQINDKLKKHKSPVRIVASMGRGSLYRVVE